MSDKAVCLLASPSAGEHVSSLPPRLSRLTSSPTSRENSYFDGWPRHGMTRSLLYSLQSPETVTPGFSIWHPLRTSSRTDPSFPSPPLATAAANDPKRPLLSPPFRRRRKTEPPWPSSLPSHMSSARGVYLHSANRKTPIWL